MLHNAVTGCTGTKPVSPLRGNRRLLGFHQVTEWPAIGELSTDLEPYASLYSITNEFGLRYEEWLFGPVKDLNAEEVENNVGEWFKKVRSARWYSILRTVPLSVTVT